MVGGFTLEVQVYHHSVPVPNALVLLKEEVDDFPGKSLEIYDFSSRCDINGKCTIDGIFPGNHWVYGVGFDGIDSVFGNTSVYMDPRDTDGRSKLILLVSE